MTSLSDYLHLSHRDRKAKKTREKFVNATIELLSHSGFDEISVETIAAHAGFSRRTFFRHFNTKEDLVFNWVDGVAETVMDDIINGPKTTPKQCLEAAMLSLAETFERNSKALKPLTRALYDSPTLRGRMLLETIEWEEKWSQCLKERFTEFGSNELYFKVITATVMAGYITGIRTWARNVNEQSAASYIEDAFACQSEM